MKTANVCFLVEGNTDIRFVTGLSEICNLTMAIPSEAYNRSGLKERVKAAGVRLNVHEIRGGRLRFQYASLVYLLQHAREFDLILCQEFLRGALSGTLAGVLTNTPAIGYMGISPLEYFHCRRERRHIGPVKALAGGSVIRLLLTCNGKLATKCLVMGPYLKQIADRYCRRVEVGLYYGVDTSLFSPVDAGERSALRRKLDLPPDAFIIFLSSRISHEKDPETVLRATALARQRGLDAVVINLGGGYKAFLELAVKLKLPDPLAWVLGRPAAHPMNDLAEYYQAADCVAQASLAEGLGISPLEAMACGTPAVCTRVGGLGSHMNGLTRLVPRQDAVRMSEEFIWVASHREEARAQALRGREYVLAEWTREKAFDDLAGVFDRTLSGRETIAEETA